MAYSVAQRRGGGFQRHGRCRDSVAGNEHGGCRVMMRPSNDVQVVYLSRDAADFRKRINGLSVLVEDALGLDPFSEHLFVFCNRRRNRVKILCWERSGFCLLPSLVQ